MGSVSDEYDTPIKQLRNYLYSYQYHHRRPYLNHCMKIGGKRRHFQVHHSHWNYESHYCFLNQSFLLSSTVKFHRYYCWCDSYFQFNELLPPINLYNLFKSLAANYETLSFQTLQFINMSTTTDVQGLHFLRGVIKVITTVIKCDVGVAKFSLFCMIRSLVGL